MQVTTVGLDLAKNIFQVHGIDNDGEVIFNRALRRILLPVVRFSYFLCRHALS
jgi:hypothetical protein